MICHVQPYPLLIIRQLVFVCRHIVKIIVFLPQKISLSIMKSRPRHVKCTMKNKEIRSHGDWRELAYWLSESDDIKTIYLFFSYPGEGIIDCSKIQNNSCQYHKHICMFDISQYLLIFLILYFIYLVSFVFYKTTTDFTKCYIHCIETRCPKYTKKPSDVVLMALTWTETK